MSDSCDVVVLSRQFASQMRKHPTPFFWTMARVARGELAALSNLVIASHLVGQLLNGTYARYWSNAIA